MSSDSKIYLFNFWDKYGKELFSYRVNMFSVEHAVHIYSVFKVKGHTTRRKYSMLKVFVSLFFGIESDRRNSL